MQKISDFLQRKHDFRLFLQLLVQDAGGLHFFQSRTQLSHHRLADAQTHQAVHVVRLFQYLGRLFLDDAHDVVHEGIFERHGHVFVHRLLNDRSFIQCQRSRHAVGHNQAARP